MLPFCWPPQAKAHYWMIISLLQGLSSEGQQEKNCISPPSFFFLTTLFILLVPNYLSRAWNRLAVINQSDSSICISKSSPFDSSLPHDQGFDQKQGYRWLCYDANLPFFVYYSAQPELRFHSEGQCCHKFLKCRDRRLSRTRNLFKPKLNQQSEAVKGKCGDATDEKKPNWNC